MQQEAEEIVGGTPAARTGSTSNIEFDGVVKYYHAPPQQGLKLHRHTTPVESVHALQNIHLTINPGEFVSLLGPSGCGKTTLLKCLDGLVPYDEGHIRVGGTPITGPGRDRAFVFQSFGLFPWRTVLGNVTLPLEAAGKHKTEREQTARHFIELVGLAGFADRHPHELSGGMQQRVGLARALAVDPDILLMDEPFGALDAQTRELMQAELLQIWENNRKTVVFVTHSVDEALFLSQRIVIMSARPGTIVKILDVPFPYPRTGADIKLNPLFAELRHEIWEMLAASQNTFNE